MNDITSVPLLVGAAAILAAIVLIHILTVFVTGQRTSTVLGYVNILLHLPMLVALLFSGASLEWALLAVLISVFAYTLCHYIRYSLKARADERSATPSDNGDTEEGGQ